MRDQSYNKVFSIEKLNSQRDKTLSIELDQLFAKELKFTSEWVFYTIQGEGKFLGHPSIFIRLSGCNLRCAWKNPNGQMTICDTPYSSYNPDNFVKTIGETIGEVKKYPCKRIVITGGEPFIYPELPDFVNYLEAQDYHVTIETNGTIYYDHCNAHFLSISPKLKSSQIPIEGKTEVSTTKAINIEVLAKMVRRPHQLKFVVHEEKDITEIHKIISEIKGLNGHYDERNIFLMPQGITPQMLDQRSDWIIETCKKLNWNFTDRLHLRIWNNRRGK